MHAGKLVGRTVAANRARSKQLSINTCLHSKAKRLVHVPAGNQISEPVDSKEDSGLIKIERQPFPRLPITNSGVSALLPRSQVLKKVFATETYTITQAKLMELAVEFARINSSSAEVTEAMEKWRQKVLDAFGGQLREITRVAGMLLKLCENKALAFALYKVAGEEGYRNAAHYYAMMLGTQSVSVKGAQAQSHKIIKQLAKGGHAPSQMVLADVLLAKNNDHLAREAIGLLESAASSGMSRAVYKLGDVYRKGLGGITKDYEKAMYWYGRAAEMDIGEAWFAMGNMYSEGVDGQPDFTKALGCFEKAALRDIAEAQYNVGVYYLEGRGVKKNANLAVEYWLMAAAKRFPVAALNLGKLFAEGKEVERNYRRARDMLSIAIECSDPQKIIERSARDVLRKVEQEQEGQDEAMKLAFNIFNVRLHVPYAACVLLLPFILGSVTERVFVQQLDHFAAPNRSSLTFPQRYLVADTYYRQGGPVILYGVGERAIDEADLTDGWVMEMAERTHGMAVLLEQRFYGQSRPAADALRETANVYGYLAVEQMMADIKNFIRRFPSDKSAATLFDGSDKEHEIAWILVGGSFAGSLVAWTKHRYPELGFFALASSSPMKLTDEYWQFDKVAAERLPCAQELSAAVQKIDRLLDNTNDRGVVQSMKKQFGLGANATDEMLAAELSLPTSWMMQQPVSQLANKEIGDFCKMLQKGSGGSDADAINALASISRAFSSEHRIQTPLSECPAANDDLAWLWQQCTELGLWQTAPPEHKEPAWFARRLRSRRLTPAYFASQCRRCFPESPMTAAVAAERKHEFRRFANDALAAYETPRASVDTVFTGGSLDPWKHTFVVAGGLAVEITGASHAEDLMRCSNGGASEDVCRAQRVISQAIERWIKEKKETRALSLQNKPLRNAIGWLAAATSSGVGRWAGLLVLLMLEAVTAAGLLMLCWRAIKQN
ncbi:hypothetical protein FB639_000158 [Coemansia asiatica]|nr:hypothetical protein FB639_000158 [Coemansia asiatica]